MVKIKKLVLPVALSVLMNGCSSMPRYNNTQERTFPNQVTYGYSFPDSSLRYIVMDGLKYSQGDVFEGANKNWKDYKADKTQKQIERTELVTKKEKGLWEKIQELF